MKRIFSPLAAMTAMVLCAASPSWAAEGQANTNISASSPVAASPHTDFSGRIDRSVNGWVSADNDAAGRAEMAASPSTNPGPTSTAEISAEIQSQQARTDARAGLHAGVSGGIDGLRR